LKNKLEEQRALATIGHIYLSSYLNLPGPENKDKLTLANKFLMKSLVVSQTLNGQISKVELADMSARLFSNLGVVQDCLENFDKALELLNKSIVLCRSNDLFEQLQRGYLSLASIFMKKGDSRSALQQYNLAAEAASKLRDKPILLADILINKSELLLKLGDFCAAKSALLKAYRLKIPDLNDRRVIENKLRVVASMSSNEDKLIMTEDTDYKTLKTLYEKMGDGACVLKMFDRAADYYKKMLDSAEKANLMESELATCYYSLAETYKDNKQYKEAIVYFEKELSLCRSFKDSLNTFWKIAETRELADDPISEVQAVYTRALERCQREGDVHEEGKMLKRFILYLRRQKQHSEAFQLEQSLAKLNYQSSESDSDSSDAPTTSIVGGDIDLDALTGKSDPIPQTLY
jgi:NF-kappa-B inhibitor-like protein 2